MKKTAYEIVTDRIIEQLEKGVVPWQKPWRVTNHKNFITKKPYRGVNVFIMMISGFNCPYWGTFKQISEKGGSVKKGSKGTPIIFTNWKEIKDKETDEVIKKYPITRYYTVFNLEQTVGIDWESWDKEEKEIKTLEECEKIVSKNKNIPKIVVGGNVACYSPSFDEIRMPKIENFKTSEGYYSTLFHESVHSTGHKDRLSRVGITGAINFGSEQYSQEELVAEIGACFLNSKTGIENMVFENNSAYVANWLTALKNDRKMICVAAAQAQTAVDFILDGVNKRTRKVHKKGPARLHKNSRKTHKKGPATLSRIACKAHKQGPVRFHKKGIVEALAMPWQRPDNVLTLPF